MKVFEYKKQSGTDDYREPFFEEIDYYREQLLNKEALMEFLAILAEKTIRKFGWNSDDFSLNRMSALLFMSGDMELLMREFDADYSIVFQYVSEDEVICVSAEAVMDESGEIQADTQVLLLKDYAAGNRDWLLLTKNEKGKPDGGSQDAGMDYFNLEYILRNEEPEWIAAQEQGFELPD